MPRLGRNNIINNKLLFILSINFLAIFFLVFYESGRGKDVNWDLLNYHYYSVYSLLHDRMSYDIAPANLQSFFNPILNIPSYLAIRYLPVIGVRPAISILHGLSFSLVFTLSLFLMSEKTSDYYRYFLATSAGAMAICGPVFLDIAGTSFVDDLCALPILGSLILLFACRETPPWTGDAVAAWPTVGGSAFLMGIAVGLKPTNMVFAVGYAAAMLVTAPFGSWAALRSLWRRCVVCAAGGMLGVLLSYGWWGLKLYRLFGSIMFPYYNKFFRSAFYPEENFIDTLFLPKSYSDIIFMPFRWLRQSAGQDPFNSMKDARFSVVLILIVVYATLSVWRSLAIKIRPGSVCKMPADLTSGKNTLFLLAFFVGSFYVWIIQFSIRRYIVPLEVLSPVILIVLINRTFNRRWRTVAWLTVLTTCIFYGRPLFQREAPLGERYFETDELAAPFRGTQTTFLMTNGWEPLSYVIPAFSPDNRFIHLGANLQVEPGTPYGRIAQNDIDNAPGPLKMITNIPGMDLITLARFGLRPTGRCSVGRTVVDVIHICDLERAPPSQESAAAPLHLDQAVSFSETGAGWAFEQNGSCWSRNDSWGVLATPTGAPWCSLLLFRWDDGQATDLQFNVMMHAVIPTKGSGTRTVKVELNGKALGSWSFTDSAPSMRSVLIAKELIHPGTNVLRFSDGHPVSPGKARADGTDDDKLSFGLHWMSMTEARETGLAAQ